MIFSVGNHIKQIIEGTKTQTRRTSSIYHVGRLYSIQPKRTAKGIKDGKIQILAKTIETQRKWTSKGWMPKFISKEDAKAEGGYNSLEFEMLYEKLHPKWVTRWAYTFRFIPKELLE